jgi:hypothetical protein
MKFQFSKTACWLAVLPIACLVFSGCTLLYAPSGYAQIGVVPRGKLTNALVQIVLPRHAHSIYFQCTNSASEERVIVTLTNVSSSKVILSEFGRIPPHTGALLYEGSLSNLLGSKVFFLLSSRTDRVPCELHIRFPSAATLSAPIRVLCYYAYPTL